MIGFGFGELPAGEFRVSWTRFVAQGWNVVLLGPAESMKSGLQGFCVAPRSVVLPAMRINLVADQMPEYGMQKAAPPSRCDGGCVGDL